MAVISSTAYDRNILPYNYKRERNIMRQAYLVKHFPSHPEYCKETSFNKEEEII